MSTCLINRENVDHAPAIPLFPPSFASTSCDFPHLALPEHHSLFRFRPVQRTGVYERVSKEDPKRIQVKRLFQTLGIPLCCSEGVSPCCPWGLCLLPSSRVSLSRVEFLRTSRQRRRGRWRRRLRFIRWVSSVSCRRVGRLRWSW